MLFFLTPIISFAQNSPKDTVASYCTLDFNGARIGGHQKQYEQIRVLNSWQEEPGWDRLVIISSFLIGPTQQKDSLAKVVVGYTVVGRRDSFFPVDYVYEYEEVTFNLSLVDMVWIIDRIENKDIKTGFLIPHISLQALIENIKVNLLHEKDDSQKTSLISDLAKAKTILEAKDTK